MGDLQKLIIIFMSLWVLTFPYIAFVTYLNYGLEVMIGLMMGWVIVTVVVFEQVRW